MTKPDFEIQESTGKKRMPERKEWSPLDKLPGTFLALPVEEADIPFDSEFEAEEEAHRMASYCLDRGPDSITMCLVQVHKVITFTKKPTIHVEDSHWINVVDHPAAEERHE